VLASREQEARGSSPAAGAASTERLQGALEVVVTHLTDRAFATQTAVVHFAHTLARQAHALSSANQQLRTTRQVGCPADDMYCCTALVLGCEAF
jgi:hypothetical protein